MNPLKKFTLIAVGGLGLALAARAQVTNTVSNSGFAYTFSTTPGTDPTLTLYRGVTYIFSNTVVGLHPLYIKTNVSAGMTDQYTEGVSGNGNSLVTFAVPNDAPNQLSYNCANHSITFGMHGFLNISNPPAPPNGQIVLISLSPTQVTMQSLGSSNWTAVPEFNSNLISSVWAAVPNAVLNYTNVFSNGTNTATFDRLEPICGPNVFLRVRNQFP